MMSARLLSISLVITGSALLASCAAPRTTPPGATAPAAPAESLGFSAERLARLDGMIQDHIDRGQLAGGVVYIARHAQIAHLKAYGQQDIAAGKPMPTDAIFRIASMSKAVTSIAVMMLYEEGKFLLHDPVSNYIPEFKNARVAVAPPAGSPPGTPYTTEPAAKPITILQLLTHTAGITYGDGPAVADYKQAKLHGWYLLDHDETIGDAVKRLASLPLQGQPGEAWQYGYSTDVLGYLVEVVSGQTLDEFFKQRIFSPLNLKDTAFYPDAAKAGRLAPVYGIEKGKLMLMETSVRSDFLHGPRKLYSGGAGLTSTASDYGRILQMLLNGGELEGQRLLSPKSVELMRTNLVGDKYRPRLDTDGFGAGFWVIDDLGFYGELGSESAYGWGSAYYPQYIVDPKEDLIAIFMTQLRPAPNPDLARKFKVLTYQSLVK